MKLCCGKLLFYKKLQKNLKNTSLQINYGLSIQPILTFEVDIRRIYGDIFSSTINLLGLFFLRIGYTEKCDHAGLDIEFNILGLNIYYRHVDSRHWDYDNEKWEES